MSEPDYESAIELINTALAVTSLTKIETVGSTITSTPSMRMHYGLVRGFNGDSERQVTMSQDMDLDAEWVITSITWHWNDDTQPDQPEPDKS